MLAELAHPDAVVFPTTVAVYREVEEVDGVLVDSPHPGLLLDDGGEDDDDDDARRRERRRGGERHRRG